MTDRDRPEYRGRLVAASVAGTAVVCMVLLLSTPFLAMELLYAALMLFSIASICVVGISYSYATLLARRDLRIESTMVLALVAAVCSVTAGLLHLCSALPHTVTTSAAMACASTILFVGASAVIPPWVLPRRQHRAGQISLAAILFTTAVCAVVFELLSR